MKIGRKRNPRLMAALAESGLTQIELAARCDLTRGTINNLVCMRYDPAPETAALVARELGTTVGELWPGLEE